MNQRYRLFPILIESFLRPYGGLSYSDYARLRTFVVLLWFLGLVALALLPILAEPTWLTRVFLGLWACACAVLLLVIRKGGRAWAEGMAALGFASLFLALVFFDATLQANPLADTLLLAYAVVNLVLVTVTNSNARWLIATGLIYLAAEFVFRYGVQAKLSLVFPYRFVILEVTVCTLLVMVQRIIRRANALADEAQARLLDANRELASTVDQQAHELQRAVDQVRAAQTSLSEGDKLSTVGRFIAGIAHEINTPLAAIESSASNMRGLLKSLGALLFDGSHDWSRKDFAMVLDILDTADLSGLGVSSRDRRNLRKQLPEGLPPKVADGLAYWGLSRAEPRWVEYLTSPRGPVAFELLAGIVELYRSAATVVAASGKASLYVRELRKFIAKDRSATPPEPVSVIQGLETFLLLYQNQLRGKIDVVRSYPDDDPQVLGHPNRLLQVWSNLISNAVGAMGDRGTLGLTVRAEEGVVVEVSDDGPGIPEAIQHQIFEPFFTTKPAGDGMGLGLEIVKTLVEEHQGTVTFESRPGRTVFRVTLPLAAAR